MNEHLIRAAVGNDDLAEALARMDAMDEIPIDIRERIDEVATDVCRERLAKLTEPQVEF